MEIRNWNPKQERTNEEEYLLKRLKRNKKLFAFLRENRQELFDEEFQAELALMYRDTGAGKEPVTPAMMAMAVLLQEYAGVSDAEAVELTVVDKRWQLVLGQLGETRPAFSQGAFWDFRARLIRHDMDRRLLERTRELARKTKGFDWKKLPQQVRVAMDSSPLEGAGRVEDTLNLLAHAARKIVTGAAPLEQRQRCSGNEPKAGLLAGGWGRSRASAGRLTCVEHGVIEETFLSEVKSPVGIEVAADVEGA